MENYTKYGLGAAFGGVIIKMGYFLWVYPNEDWDMYVRFAYLLLFLLALFLGLRSFKADNPNTDLTIDVKTGMKTTSIFAIIISAFTWVYYKFINPEYFAGKIEDVKIAIEQSEKATENAINTAEFIFNAFTHSTITLFGMMIIGFFYTLILVLIMRAKPEVFNA
ncbi:DUF4199 domain-containing protein [Salibacteraceae bacterium]|nr:DUF4199 domain-containing protein [Salibacteraceae bacterium]